jgi:hypothetical protein
VPDLNELGLTDASVPEVDWDAPEGGASAPQIYPGYYQLQFALDENPSDWFDSITVNAVQGDASTAQKYLVLIHKPVVLYAFKDAVDTNPIQLPAELGKVQLPPQRASFYKSPRMMISNGAELLRACGVRLNNILQEIKPAVTQLNGRASFRAEIGWRAYFKTSEVTVSTHPRKKKGDVPWPKGPDGQYLLSATNPQTGEKAFGYPDIVRVILPQK